LRNTFQAHNSIDEYKFKFLCAAITAGSLFWIVWGFILESFYPQYDDSPAARLPVAFFGLFCVFLVRRFYYARVRYAIILMLPVLAFSLHAIYIEYANAFPPELGSMIPTLVGLSIYGFFRIDLLAIYSVVVMAVLAFALTLLNWGTLNTIHFLNFLTLIVMGFLFVAYRIRILNTAQENIRLLATEQLKNEDLVSTAAQVAHDIRAPLMALGVLKDNLDPAAPGRELLESAIRRIESTASELLMELRHQKSGPTAISCLEIKTVLEKLIAEFNVTNKIPVELHLDPLAMDSRFTLHSERFERVISNLLNNARDSFESIDSNIARSPKINISILTDGSFVEIQIEDNGQGIPAKLVETLGQKGATYGKKSGNGLGLWSARLLAESSGGQFSVKSKENIGTTINLSFPALSG
jgi:signal transduction histidine kinase